MAKTKKELYSFDIDIEDEVEEKVVKEIEKKNEETGETEKVEEEVVRKKKIKTPVCFSRSLLVLRSKMAICFTVSGLISLLRWVF